MTKTVILCFDMEVAIQALHKG